MQQCTINTFILSITKKLVLGCIFLASWPLFSTKSTSTSSSFMNVSSLNTAFMGAVSLGAFKNPHFALQKLQKPLSVTPPNSNTPHILQKNVSPLGTLPPLKKFTLPKLSLPQTVASTVPTLPLLSQTIRIKVENHLPDGAIIRSFYKDKDEIIWEDQTFQFPDTTHVEIPLLKKRINTTATFIALQCLDCPNNSIVKEFSKKELKREQDRQSEPGKKASIIISLVRKKQMGRTQLPPLENRENRQKSMRQSALLKNTLIPIREDERDNESLSEITFSTHSPSISPTSSQSLTSSSISSLSLISLAEETEEDEEVI